MNHETSVSQAYGPASTRHTPTQAHAQSAAPRTASLASERSIGALLIDAGRLTTEQAEKILRRQKENGERFGEAALALGLLRDEDLHLALARQYDYPYLAAGDTGLSVELVAAYQPFSPVVEQLRALRSQLMLRWFDAEAGRKLLAIAAAEAQAGRSHLAANLAIVCSQLGERTLLIDADLRAPRQHELFKLANQQGLSTLLAGRCDLEAVQRIPGLLDLSVLPAGPLAPNPQELIGRPQFASTLARLAECYDVIILDTPAAAAGADVHTIAARCGAALLVARQHQSSLPALQQLAATLQQAGVQLLGSVLNDC